MLGGAQEASSPLILLSLSLVWKQPMEQGEFSSQIITKTATTTADIRRARSPCQVLCATAPTPPGGRAIATSLCRCGAEHRSSVPARGSGRTPGSHPRHCSGSGRPRRPPCSASQGALGHQRPHCRAGLGRGRVPEDGRCGEGRSYPSSDRNGPRRWRSSPAGASCGTAGPEGQAVRRGSSQGQP